MRKILGIVVLAVLFSSSAHANCVNVLGVNYCAPPGGGIQMNMGVPYCGLGQCIKHMGVIYCSNVQMGSAFVNMGMVKCQGGCVRGNRNLCQRM